MRYALISDIHSNWQALEAVLISCQQNRVQKIFCIGDIVGYGPNPKECLDLIRKKNIISVAGNHDWAVSGRLDPSYFTSDGKVAILWSRGVIGLEDYQYLNSLALTWSNEHFFMAHATANHPENFTYLDDIEKTLDSFAAFNQKVCFVGHTHVPQIYILHHEKVYQWPQVEIELKDDDRYIVNVGSVGQPRDGNPLASYCIYDVNQQTIEIKRVQYDHQLAAQKIIAAGLPEKLASRLSLGA